MRYRVISTEPDRSEHFVNQNIAGFRHAADALAFIKRLECPAYVIDAFTLEVLDRNYER